MVRRLSAVLETLVQYLGWEDSLEKEMATHSSILAWKIPWTEEPGGLQSMGSQSQTRLSNFTFNFSCALKSVLQNKRSHHNEKPAHCTYRKAGAAAKT